MALSATLNLASPRTKQEAGNGTQAVLSAGVPLGWRDYGWERAKKKARHKAGPRSIFKASD